jgi:hypothetical protein
MDTLHDLERRFASGVPEVSVWQNPNIMSRLPIPRSRRTEAYIRIQRDAGAQLAKDGSRSLKSTDFRTSPARTGVLGAVLIVQFQASYPS